MTIQIIIRVLTKCAFMKAFWSFMIVATTFGVLMFQHSWHTCAGMAVFVMISLLALYEEYNDSEPDAKKIPKRSCSGIVVEHSD